MLNAIKVVKLPSFGVVSLLENMLSFYLTLPKVSTSIPLWENPLSWGPKPQIWYYKPLINPKLGGSFFYTPPQIHYLASRNNHFDVVETQISESDTKRVDSVWWWRFHSNTSFSQSTIMSDIYLTLPSKNWSIKYFPNNKKQFMKNR